MTRTRIGLAALIVLTGCGGTTPEPPPETWRWTLVRAVLGPAAAPHQFGEPRTWAVAGGRRSRTEVGYLPAWELDVVRDRGALLRDGFDVTVYLEDEVWGERVLAGQVWLFSEEAMRRAPFTVVDPEPWGKLLQVTTRLERVR